tara:strand:- start:265 stop:1251 length:987 start_codon:yes stop_codon:yes gene_type:complete
MRDLANQGGVKDPRSYTATGINSPIGMRSQGNPPPQAQPQPQPEGLAALAAGAAGAEAPATTYQSLLLEMAQQNPEEMGESQESVYKDRVESSGINALAQELTDSRKATTAFNTANNDPRKLARERLFAGMRNARGQGFGDTMGSFSRNLDDERVTQEAAQLAALNQNRTMLGEDYATRLELTKGAESAYDSGITAGRTARNGAVLAGVEADLKSQANKLLAETNQLQRNRDSRLDISEMRLKYIDKMASITDKMEEAFVASVEPRLMRDARKGEGDAPAQVKDLREQYYIRNGYDVMIERLEKELESLNSSGSGGSGGFTLDSVREG